MEDVAEAFRVANLATNRGRLQVSHNCRRRLESLEARRTLVLEATVTVVAVVQVGLEILPNESLEAVGI